MNPRRVFSKWAAIGLVTGAFLIWAQASAVGGLAGMLEVGQTSALRPIVERQLGPVPLAEGPGHDGQIYYAMALDLSGDQIGPLLDHAAYRYRRILYPLVASGFGVLEGWPLLYGLLAVGTSSFAASAGLVALMATRAGRSELLALTVLLNPGVWLSVQLVTSDVFALALMLVGLYAFTRRRTDTPAWFSLSALAKDVSLATPVPLGIRFRDWTVALAPVTVLTAWMLYLEWRFGGGFSARGNLTWPLLGILDATTNWWNLEPKEWVFLVFALGSVMAGIVFSFRRSWLRWPLTAWSALALVSSDWVWDFGNNAVRAFAPIVVLVALTVVYERDPESFAEEARNGIR